MGYGPCLQVTQSPFQTLTANIDHISTNNPFAITDVVDFPVLQKTNRMVCPTALLTGKMLSDKLLDLFALHKTQKALTNVNLYKLLVFALALALTAIIID